MINNNVKEKEFKNFIGIDVAKDKFDIYNDIDEKYKTIPNQKQSIEDLCNNYLDELIIKENLNKDELLVVIDLTGGYEKEIISTFYANGYINILLAEGLKVKNFSKSTKYNRAKTDKMDAFVLSEYGKMFYKTLKLYKPIERNREEITLIYNRIEDLKDLLKQERTRFKAPNIQNNLILKKSIEKNIKNLESEIKELGNYITTIIKKDKELKVIYDTLLNQEGIGEEMALFLLIKIRELGRIEKKQLASICGLAPVPRDSGTSVHGHRYVRGGRKEIKSKMFFCIVNMTRFSDYIKDRMNYYCDKGKPKKCAMIILARKKIVIINARVRDALKANNL